MNWNHLYCFYEVARHNSLKKAASFLGNAPSTISEQVKKLENSLDVVLFNRSGRELFLTKEGESVYIYAKEIYEKGKRLIDAVSHNDVAGYSVQVGIENHLECSSIFSFLESYWEIYSDFGVVETRRSKNLSQSIYFLEHSVADWIVSTAALNDELYSSLKIDTLSYGFFCSEQLQREGLGPKELLSMLPIANFGGRSNESTLIKNQLLNQGISIKEELSSDHPELLLNLCRKSKLILLLPISKSVNINGIVPILSEFKVMLPVYAIYKKSNEQLLFIKKLVSLLSSSKNSEENIITKYLNVSQLRNEQHNHSDLTQ